MAKLSPDTKIAFLGAASFLVATGAVALTDWRVDMSRLYIRISTEMNPSVSCSKRGEPTLRITLNTPVSNAEKFSIKVRSEDGKTVEKEIPATKAHQGILDEAVEVRAFNYAGGRKMDEKIQQGENLSVTASRISLVHDDNIPPEVQLVTSEQIAKTNIQANCPINKS